MVDRTNLNELCDELKRFLRSSDLSLIVTEFDHKFDRIGSQILPSCLERKLSDEEKSAIDLLSSFELKLIRYLIDAHNAEKSIEEIQSIARKRLFQRKIITALENVVECAREKHLDDEILLFLSRMSDARTLSYRLFWQDLDPKPRELHEEFHNCILHSKMKNSIDQTIFPDDVHQKLSLNSRRFFLGCSTFAVALFRGDGSYFDKNNETLKKLTFRWVKFIRTILSEENFDANDSNIYFLRGVFALLTNKTPMDQWLPIINEALTSEVGSKARRENPFNINLFSLIITKLFASKKLQRDAQTSVSNDGALLIDVAMIFLQKWCFTALKDEKDEIPNQVIEFLRSPFDENERKIDKTELFLFYLGAKNQRIRLMAFAILANIMSYEDLKKLQESQTNIAKDLVDLIFVFIRKAAKQELKREYRGISFDYLLQYLHRFLIQDIVKKATLRYLPDLIHFAAKREPIIIEILRRISSNRELRDELCRSEDLTKFLRDQVDVVYGVSQDEKDIIENIRQNLRPDPLASAAPVAPVDPHVRQAFISYCQKEKKLREKFVHQLRDLNVFTDIWIDQEHMKDDMFETIPAAIKASEVVFALVSQNYCESDVCRLELYFAKKVKKKVIAIVLQREFKISAYDWLNFLTGHDQYYRIDDDAQMSKLFRQLKSIEIRKTTTETKVREASPRTYQNKSSKHWTSIDVRHWCEDNHFDTWISLLKDYDGRGLFELNQTLSNEKNLPHFISVSGLNVVEVTRFKYKLDELLSQQPSRISSDK